MTCHGVEFVAQLGVSRLTRRRVAPMTTDREPLLTTDDLGRRLRMPVETVQTLARRGELPGFKVGKSWRFRPSSIEKWERQREREAAS